MDQVITRGEVVEVQKWQSDTSEMTKRVAVYWCRYTKMMRVMVTECKDGVLVSVVDYERDPPEN